MSDEEKLAALVDWLRGEILLTRHRLQFLEDVQQRMLRVEPEPLRPGHRDEA